MITEYQSHDGAVDTGTTPQVQYAYADGSANTIRQTQLIYPNGRELTYDYGAADSMDDAASRVASLIDDDGTTHLVDYSYLGQGTFVVTDYTQPETEYTLLGTAGGDDPDTGDIYRGLDRFGRIKDSYWYNYGDSSDTDRIKYGYDRVGNRLWRENVVATAAGKAFDELYQYDQIHRLQHMDRGTLNGPHTGMTTTTFAQCWTLDETGNWGGFREDDTGDGTWDLIQAREANPVNEISAISESAGPTWVSPAYSPVGNMTLMPKPAAPTESFTATYDAWNRMVKVVDTASTDTISEYAYDGATRRIVQASYDEGVLDETRHFYFIQPRQWQDIEERLGTTPDSAAATQQFVWGLRYVDDCVIRDRGTDYDEELDERLYALQDANWNVTAAINTNGAIQQRMTYTAYGIPSYYSSGWMPLVDGLAWERLYAGYFYESATGLFHVRHRLLHPLLGTWTRRDPLIYSSGMHLYAYTSSPFSFADPFGLQAGGAIPFPGGGGIPLPDNEMPLTPAQIANILAGLTLMACLNDPGCRAALKQALQDAIEALSAAALAAYWTACKAEYAAYKTGETACRKCNPVRGPTLDQRCVRCAWANMMFPCWTAAMGGRIAYILMGCDFVLENEHFDGHAEAILRLKRNVNDCQTSMVNNCSSLIFN